MKKSTVIGIACSCSILFLIVIAIAIYLVKRNHFVKINFKGNVYITMTTIPERLSNQWFLKNLIRTLDILSMDGNKILILNVPYISSKGERYIIPDSILNLEKTNPKFIINRNAVDEGPITKLLPTLRLSYVNDDDIIIVIDDDIVYKINTFNLLVNSVVKNPNFVSSMCNLPVEGFKGFAFRKSIMKGILKMAIPPSCFRIDDNVFQYWIKKQKIKVTSVPIGKSPTMFCSCAEHHRNVPQWEELRNDDRPPMIKECYRDIEKMEP